MTQSPCYSRLLLRVGLALLAAPLLTPSLATAVLSERGGTGVWELQSAESQRPARLELGIFLSYQRLDLGDAANTHVNALQGGTNASFGIPGGFEISGALPFYGYYNTLGSGGSPLDEDVKLRTGDLTGRLRWTSPFLVPGLRWGMEGEVVFATGDGHEVVYPEHGSNRPFTVGENNYTGRALLSWDGLRAGTGVPLRWHVNAGYTFQGDETRFLSPRTPLALELPGPARNRNNDHLSLGAGLEVDLPRFTLFGEIVTDQFVNERRIIKGKENRVAVTPGVRFWLPGGVSIAGAYSFNVSDDDPATAFDPGRAFPDEDWRIAISLGTVYRGARARAEDLRAERAVAPAPVVAPPPAPVAAPPSPAPAPAAAAPTPPQTAEEAEKKKAEEKILARRPIQQEPAKPKAEPEVSTPAPVKVSPGAPRPPAQPGPAIDPLRDSDGDGIPDLRDECPLLAEDWDGFQDLDGCPDLDNDQDGIPDVRDQCPNDPETYNGYYDFDGCPDEVQSRWIGPQGEAAPRRTGVAPVAPATPEPPSGALRTEDTTRAPVPRTALPRPAAPAPGVGPPTAAPQAVTPGAAPPTAPQAVTPDVAPPTTAPQAVAPGAAPPQATARPAAGGAVDSLRFALEAERRRTADLEQRLARSEAERTGLIQHIMTPPPGVVSDTVPAQATEEELRRQLALERQRRLEMAERVRALESRQDRVIEEQVARTPAAAAPSGPTVVTPPATREDSDTAARLAVIEAELQRLRSESAAAPARGAVAPQQAAPPAGPARPVDDTAAIRLSRRLDDLQATVDRLKAAPPQKAPAAEPAILTPPADARATLDLMLPVGEPRVFPEIQFVSGSARLTPEAVRAIGSVAEVLRRVPESLVRLVGFTDNVGAASFNQQLSQQRASAVAEVLHTQGVAREQLTVEGRGEEGPIASNQTAEGRKANRRVEFIRVR